MCKRWLTPSQLIASVSSAVAAVACLPVRCRVCLQSPQAHVPAMVQPQVARRQPPVLPGALLAAPASAEPQCMCRRWLTPSQLIASVSSAVAAVACLPVRCRVCLQAPQTHVSAMVQPQVARRQPPDLPGALLAAPASAEPQCMCRRWLTPSQLIASVSSAVAAVACLPVRCRVCLRCKFPRWCSPKWPGGSHLTCQERCWLRLRLRSRNACAGDG